MKEILFTKNSKVFLFFLSLLLSFFVGVRFPRSTHAQIPSPTPVPCDETRDAEFHSLRPYQASPCTDQEEELALYCANDILLTDRFSATQDGAIFPISAAGSSFPPSCIDEPDRGVILCTYSVPRTKNIAIDLTRAELPIAGNTEDVRNFTNRSTDPKDESIDDPQKVNEYISWYLHGVPKGPEYGKVDNSYPKAEDINKTSYPKTLQTLIDYSGPLQKLLPLRIQQRERIKQVEDAVDSIEANAELRHNQIVGCTKVIPYRNILLGTTLYYSVQVPCNTQNSIWDTLLQGVVFTHRLDEWGKSEDNLPPLEEDYANRSLSEYIQDYREWRGNVCTNVDLGALNFLVCANLGQNPFAVNDYFALLFPSIPFSSTEDRLGNLRLESLPPPLAQTGDPGGRGPIGISNERISGEPDSELSFAHMEENDQLADLLQQTYVSKDLDREAPVDPTSTTLVGGEFCNLAQVKTNPGDDLFGEDFETQLSYTAGFTCEYVLPDRPPTSQCLDAAESCEQVCYPGPFGTQICTEECDSEPVRCYPNGYSSCSEDYGSQGCDTGYKCGLGCDAPDVNACDITTFHTIPTYTETPYADSLWARLVAGPASAFKKIFPKIGIDGPLSEIVDVPASSGLSYSTEDPETDVTAGGVRPGASAELYFPHLGGIHEYFLQCTQELLRPQGFGPGCGDVDTVTSVVGGGTGQGALLTNVTINAGGGKLPFIVGWQSSVHLAFNPGEEDTRNALYWAKPDAEPTNWGTATNVGAARGPADYTAGSLGVAPDGKIHYVWINQVTDELWLRTRAANNGAWSPAQRIVSGNFRSYPRVGSTTNTTIIVWNESNRIRYRTVSSSGAVSSTGIVDDIQAPPAAYVANNASGKLMVAHAATNGNIYAAFWNGNGFSPAELVADGENYYNPTAAIAPDGSAHVAWRKVGGGIYYATKPSSGGSWTVTRLHNSDSWDTVGISSDGQGGLHLAWVGRAPGQDGLYYMYKSSGGSWSSPTFVGKTTAGLWNAAITAGTSASGVYGHVIIEDWSGADPVPRPRYFLFTIKAGGTGGAGGFPTPPPGSACTNMPDLTQYGLPIPQAGGTYGYNTLISRIRNEANTKWAVESMLSGEETARSRGFNVIQYLTTAWLWFESGVSARPDPYSVNCNDTSSLSNVSTYCSYSNYQIAGYQAAESRKTYNQTLRTLYPGIDDAQLRTLLNTVVANSTNASRQTWRYQGSTGLLQYLNTISSASMNNIVDTGRTLITTSERNQFLTLIAGKDPAMVAAFNSQAVSANDLVRVLIAHQPGGSNCGYGYICDGQEQILANLYAALYFYKNGCQTAGTPPPQPQ